MAKYANTDVGKLRQLRDNLLYQYYAFANDVLPNQPISVSPLQEEAIKRAEGIYNPDDPFSGTITPEMAREILGTDFAAKLIQVKESVPNNLIKAFVEVGEISDQDRERLLEMAQRTQVVSLHVRPLA